MRFKIKNIRGRNDNKADSGKVFSGANLENVEAIVSVKKKIAP